MGDMKNETKFKILCWVRKVLKYKPPMAPLDIRRGVPKVVQYHGVFYEPEIAEDRLFTSLAFRLAEELLKAEMIEVYTTKVKKDRRKRFGPFDIDEYEVRARLVAITPDYETVIKHGGTLACPRGHNADRAGAEAPSEKRNTQNHKRDN